MDVWLIAPYGPIPGEDWRDYRCTMMGRALAERGHRVVWWTANFAHHSKRFRSDSWRDVPIQEGFDIRLVPTSGYARNISLRRIVFEAVFTYNLSRRAARERSPDLIVAQSPSMTHRFGRLAERTGAKLVIDVVDLWPELFTLGFPRWLRPLSRFLLTPLYRQRRRDLRRCHGLLAVCESYLERGLHEISPAKPAASAVVFLGVDVGSIRSLQLPPERARAFGLRLGKTSGETWAIYAGSLGEGYDVATLLEAGALLEQRARRIRIVIAGDGPLRDAVMSAVESRGLANVMFVGKLGLEELVHHYQISDIGLSPYSELSTVAMPTKLYDYLAAGLPVINSLPGEVAAFLAQREIGISYRAGSAESLVEALETLAFDDERRARMSRNAYDAALEFDAGPQYRKFADFIERLG